MITKERFREIDTEIKDLVRKSLDDARNLYFENYILYIADADYYADFQNHPTISPYIIDYRIDMLNDDTRLNFLVKFLQTFYSFPTDVTEVKDDEYRIYMELMIYTHIWESKPYLRKLARFSHLCNGEDYLWKLKIPEMGRHNFIRMDIKQTFENCSNEIAEIIKKGFHTSLRNAFAHSEFHINGNRNIIHLSNYKGENWELREISFNEWTERFIHSILLCFHLLNESYNDRERIIELNNDINLFKIRHPTRDGNSFNERNIIYYPDQNGFAFER